jgi:3-oxoacyl-[acyl-carrier protein] reductase
MSPATDLSAEVALVTGGSRNIGLAIARALRAAGARVCIWGASDSAALAEAVSAIDGGDDDRCGLLVRVDDESTVLHGFDAIRARLGPGSILVNNAAIRPDAPPGDDDVSRLDSGARRDVDRRVPDIAGAVPRFAAGP